MPVVFPERRETGALLPLLLDPQHIYHVQLGKYVVEVVGDINAVLVEVVRDQGGRAAERHPGAELLEDLDVGAGHPRVLDVADDADVKSLQGPPLLHDGIGVQERLGRMGVETVPRVDDRRVDVTG